jgi:hypothetical protein
MRHLFSTCALLSVIILSAVAHADTLYTATGSDGGTFAFSETLDTTSNGDGSYTVNSISGPGITGLILPGLFNGNDNLIFPTSTSFVDGLGFAFTDTQGNTNFSVDVFSTGPGSYQAYFLDSDGVSATIPIIFSALVDPPSPNPSPASEPPSVILLGTGILGIGFLARRLR